MRNSIFVFGLFAIAGTLAACGKKAPAELASPDTSGSADAAPSASGDGGARKRSGPNLSVENATRAERPRFRKCYDDSLAKRPNEAGATQLTIKLSADGIVQDVQTSPSDLSNETLDCITNVVRTTPYDPLVEAKTIVLPLAFAPPRSSDAGADAGRRLK